MLAGLSAGIIDPENGLHLFALMFRLAKVRFGV